MVDRAQQPISVVEQTDEEKQLALDEVNTKLKTRGKTKKRRAKEKLFPLERGFSGTYVVGQKLGPPPPVDGMDFDGFESYCLEVC